MAEGGPPSSAERTILPEIRIVLLGVKDAGKSSSGNTILGRDVFQPGQRSAVCVKEQGEVAGRQVTVVETPGWFRFCDARYSAELTRTEIKLSQGLCGDGPHCFLLVIPVNVRFAKKFQQSVLTHLDLLRWSVWQHTMVLFTHGDVLGDKTIEEHINCEGEQLQWLLEECENRYHVLDNTIRNDVTELLEKIEQMIAANGLLKVDRIPLHRLQTQRRTVSERARFRQNLVQKQSERVQQSKGSHVLPGVRIVLVGQRNAGKTTARNTILGQHDAEIFKSSFCVKVEGKVADRQITVVQAPGWWLGASLQSTLEITKREIELSLSLCPPGPHVVLLALPANFHFTKQFALTTEHHMKLLGRRVWDHTIVLFTYGDWLGNTPIEKHIESEGKDLQELVERCGNRYHVLRKGDVIGLLQKIEEMVAQNDGRHFEFDQQSLCCLEEKKNAELERARSRKMDVEKRHREFLQRCNCVMPNISEYSVVILGSDLSGKRSSGNTMLGKEAFERKDITAECVRRQGEVEQGRQLTVVIAPGWRVYSEVIQSPVELTKQEILHSVSLCAPVLHAFLLALNPSRSLSHIQRRNSEEHIKLLGDQVWNHTIVLFNCGDFLRDINIEQIIESEEQIKSIVEKCGNRYHVFNNNRTRDDPSQVTDLLGKVDEMVAGHAGHRYEMDVKTTWDIEEKIKQKEEDIERRKMTVQKNTRTLEYVQGDIPKADKIRIVLLGCQGSGKSSTGNTILGKAAFDVMEYSAAVRGRKGKSVCVEGEGTHDGRRITVVEAPGWERRHAETSKPTTDEIIRGASLYPDGPCAYLLVIRPTQIQYTSDTSLQEYLEELIGENVWNNTLVLFPLGDHLKDQSIEDHIATEEGLKSLVKKCGHRYHVLNNKYRSNRTQVTELLKKLDDMLATPHLNEPVSSQREDDDDRSTSTGLDSGLGSSAKSETSSFATASEHSSGYWPDTLPKVSPACDISADSSGTKIVDSSVMETELSGLKLKILAVENQSQQLKPTNSCTSCDHIDDTTHWVLKEPSVSMAAHVQVYKHSSPPGSFECTLSGLRWVCKEDVTVEYNFSDPDIFRKELAMLQYTPIGPLMNIKVVTGELLEAHLPHFACLDESDATLKKAVRVLRSVDGGVVLETCELTRFHAKLKNPSFSLTEVLVKWGVPMKTHLEVFIYQTRLKPLVLLTYVVPRDASMIQTVEDKIKKDIPKARKIIKPQPDISIWLNSKYSLETTTRDTRISPATYTLGYTRPPYFFEVVIKSLESYFDLELVSERQSIWKATLEDYEYGEMGEVAASGQSAVSVVGDDGGSTRRTSRASDQDMQMASQSSIAAGVGVNATARSGGLTNAPVLQSCNIDGPVTIVCGPSSQENIEGATGMSPK